MRPLSLQVPVQASAPHRDLSERWGPRPPSARGCRGLVPAGALWMPGKRHLSASQFGGDTLGAAQQLGAVRVPGAQGPSGLCSFAERDEPPASPASVSSPTYGWEKQNCSSGASRVEGAKGWMGGGCHPHPRAGASAVPTPALAAQGTWAEPPS